jgi:hypothetical protein
VQTPEHVRTDASEVPEDLRARLDARAAELEQLGFEVLGWMREGDAFTLLLAHAGLVAYALVGDGETVFLSAGEDGRKLATAARTERPEWDGLAKHAWVVAEADGDTEQWQRHREEVVGLEEFEPRDVSADELIAEWADSARRAAERSREAAVARRRWARSAVPAAAALVLTIGAGAFFMLRSPGPAPAPAAVQSHAERDRELDRRERQFGMESLEVAQVLESFPPEPASERAAALVRQLRLIAIYERSPDRSRELARARAALARLRAQ